MNQSCPKIDLSTDGHVHTSFCNHAVGSMEDYVLAALRKGLKKLVFLEHLEIGIQYFEKVWLSEADFDRYFQEGYRLQEKYRESLVIGLGVEVGYNPEKITEIKTFLAKYPWDRIGISHHFLRLGNSHVNLVSRQKNNIAALVEHGIEKVQDAYIRGVLRAVDELGGNVLCHLDAVMRYHPEAHRHTSWQLLLPELFEGLTAHHMAVEINTSGFAIRGEPFPAAPILKAVIAGGIPLVVGSDAHRPEDVGRYFDRVEAFIAGDGRSLTAPTA